MAIWRAARGCIFTKEDAVHDPQTLILLESWSSAEDVSFLHVLLVWGVKLSHLLNIMCQSWGYVLKQTMDGISGLADKEIRVLVGTKNSHPVGFYSRNSTKSTINHKHNNPQTLPPWWCCLPLSWHGIYGSARSDAHNLFWRSRAGGWWKRII